MKKKILSNAKTDIPLYFKDFESFWSSSLKEIKDDDLHDAYKATLVFKNWKIVFHSLNITNYDQMIDELYEDINSSFFLALFGLYRSAHMHMRSSIELSLQLLYFLHHPIEFFRWKNGDFVIKHSELIDYLSTHPNFTIEMRNFLGKITANWKNFSKHIHGEAPIFFQCEKDSYKTNTFSKEDFGRWKSNFTQNVYKINKLLLLFFKNEINRFPENSRNLLVELLTQEDKALILPA